MIHPAHTSSRLAAAALAAAAAAPAAFAHVTLPPGGATAGSDYAAAFRVGHACKDAKATTALRVRIPPGFTPLEAVARPGWTATLTPTEVAWVAKDARAALPAKEHTQFIVRGSVGGTPGPLWFKVLQVCDVGQTDWAQVPAREGDKPEFPAARLDVLPAGVAPVDVRDAWIRSAVAGQSATGVFATLTTGTGLRLVGGNAPWADAVEVHEMRMEGDVMRMRPLANGLDLPPGQAVELRPGGLHLMVMGLHEAAPDGAMRPLTLNFVDRQGRASSLTLQVPVRTAPAAASAAHHHGS